MLFRTREKGFCSERQVAMFVKRTAEYMHGVMSCDGIGTCHNRVQGPAKSPAPRQSPEPSKAPASEATESVMDEGERARRKRTPNWKGKPEVLEQVNELIAELDGVGSSIANQVRPVPSSHACLGCTFCLLRCHM